MPLTKEKNRRIYITAFVISFLLIVGSIYLHLRQKTHLGRMSFNLDRDRVKPTSGVDIDTSTWKMEEHDSKFSSEDYSDEDLDENIELLEGSSTHNDDDILNSGEFDTEEDINDDEDNDDDIGQENDNYEIEDTHDDSDNDDIIDDYQYIERYDSDFCLRCLCMTINECRTTYCSSDNPCGLYKISKVYWIDAGQPTIAGGSTENEDQDYLTCVNDASCSATTIRQYFARYQRDCNKDGKFNCEDLIMLHFLGPSGCLKQNLSYIHANRMNTCFNESNFNYSFSEEY